MAGTDLRRNKFIIARSTCTRKGAPLCFAFKTGANEDRGRDRQPERLGGLEILEIYDELEPGRLLMIDDAPSI
jgi:hypothetical protein